MSDSVQLVRRQGEKENYFDSLSRCSKKPNYIQHTCGVLKWIYTRRSFVMLTVLVVISLFVFQSGILNIRPCTTLIQMPRKIKFSMFSNPRNVSYIQQGNLIHNHSILKNSTYSSSKNQTNATKLSSTPRHIKKLYKTNKKQKKNRKENEKRRHFIQIAKLNAMSKDATSLLMKTLVEFDKLWRQKLGLHYHLYGGTLLGAYRHSGIIPYDDDMDILVPIRFVRNFERYLFGSTLKSSKCGARMRKIYLRDYKRTRNVGDHEWRWPYIDVFFEENDVSEGHVRDLDFTSYNFELGDIYPTILMDLGGHEFPVPRCAQKVILKLYGKDFMTKCCTHVFSHRRKEGVPSACSPCADLKDLYEFTTWKRIDNEYAERRVFKNGSLISKMKRVYLPKCIADSSLNQ